MKIRSFQIKNYRSIKDSGVCYLSGDNITVLAGKNESGKTAILEALEDFNRDRQIRDEAIPLNNAEAKPETRVTFEVDEVTIREISQKIDFPLKTSRSVEFTYIKRHPSEYKYSLSESNKRVLGLRDERAIRTKEKDIKNCYSKIEKIYAEFPQIGGALPKLDLSESSLFGAQLSDFQRNTQPNLTQITDDEKRNLFTEALAVMVEEVAYIDNLRSAEQRFITQLMQQLPNFILFSSFDYVFPSEIALAEARNDELIKDLDIISDLKLDLVTSGSAPLKKSHKEQLNVRLQEDYRMFWTQDLTNLSIDWDSNSLQFFVREGDTFYPPKMRSKGKQWHLAFYIRVSARARENVPNVILIDEPGLYLHAQAQKDVIKKLEDCAHYTPIVYSTHSPYLIEIDKLHRVRLVLRNTEKEGTVISNKIHKDADKETLTPIITAIGLDLSLGLDIAKNNNIIFEGISDYYYLRASQEILQFEFRNEVHFIPGTGAEKVHLLVSLMIGWGLNYCVVLDNDTAGRKIKERLTKNFGHTKIEIIMVSDNKDEQMEDLFAKDDFSKHVLNEDIGSLVSRKPSQILRQKEKNYDKVLLSKNFYEKAVAGSVQLSEETKENFSKLLSKVNSLLFKTS